MLALLKRYRELILVAVLLLVPLGVFFAHARRATERSRLGRAIVWVATPVEKVVGWTVKGVLDAWGGYVALRGAHARAHELELRVRDLELERQQLLSERGEVERLRKLLAFAEESPQRRYVGARVIGVRLGTVGLQLLTLDRGEDERDRARSVRRAARRALVLRSDRTGITDVGRRADQRRATSRTHAAAVVSNRPDRHTNTLVPKCHFAQRAPITLCGRNAVQLL